MAKPAFRDLFVVFSGRLTNNDCLIDTLTHTRIHMRTVVVAVDLQPKDNKNGALLIYCTNSFG